MAELTPRQQRRLQRQLERQPRWSVNRPDAPPGLDPDALWILRTDEERAAAEIALSELYDDIQRTIQEGGPEALAARLGFVAVDVDK